MKYKHSYILLTFPGTEDWNVPVVVLVLAVLLQAAQMVDQQRMSAGSQSMLSRMHPLYSACSFLSKHNKHRCY